MSASIYTVISFKGGVDELFTLMKALQTFETDRQKEYQLHSDCGYIESTEIIIGSKKMYLNMLSDDQLKSLVSGKKKEITVNAEGPYGVFSELGEVGLFETLARAVPTAYLKGYCSGFMTGAEVSLDGELKDGMLSLKSFYLPDEEKPEDEDEMDNNFMSLYTTYSTYDPSTNTYKQH